MSREWRVYLSPSAQTGNKYAYGSTSEGIVCPQIANFCKEALEAHGIITFNGAGKSYTERYEEAKQNMVDLYIPIHTNAFNGKVTGTRMFVRNFKDEPSYKWCKIIFANLDAVCPGTSSNIKEYPRLTEFIHMEGTPSVYCECEFHDNPEMAKWIINHKQEIGYAIAKGVCECFGIPWDEDLQVGDAVRLKPEATVWNKDYKPSAWVFKRVLYVQKINGDRVWLSIYKQGATTCTVDKKYVVKE